MIHIWCKDIVHIMIFSKVFNQFHSGNVYIEWKFLESVVYKNGIKKFQHHKIWENWLLYT